LGREGVLRCLSSAISLSGQRTSRPYTQGLLTPHSHMEYTMGRPVAFRALPMSA